MWIISGDFNAIRTQVEKSDPNFDLHISNMFNRFINKHFLMDHKLYNRKYTWSNGTHLALLDRFLTTVDWGKKYHHSVIKDLCKNRSNYVPFLMQVEGHANTAILIHIFNLNLILSSWNKKNYVD